eukprot:7943434-Pyramimonas_sp.AAC.1
MRDSQLDGGATYRHRDGEDRRDQRRGLRRSARRTPSGRRLRRRSQPAETDGARRRAESYGHPADRRARPLAKASDTHDAAQCKL